MTDAAPSDDLPCTLTTILDSLDALIYVADMESFDILYMNEYGRRLWGAPEGRKCYEVIQRNQDAPCSFCTNCRLLDDRKEPTGPFVWEIKSTRNGRWYQCRDQAVRWSDGRLVRLEIATEITDRKRIEEELKAARQTAEDLAHTDELTALHNRRAFFAMGQKALSHAERSGETVSLVMFDADNFKQINDRYGHHTGDQVLVAIARAVSPLVREADILARIGGEEFAVLMLNADRAQARKLAQRLRETIACQRIDCADGELQFTASFGISSSENGPYSLEKMLSDADHAMYLAKSRGRNQVAEPAT